MTNLVETPTWEDGIYQWEESDPVVGGVDGIDNVPTRQLANRTKYLKVQLEATQGGMTAHEAAADPHPGYVTDAEADSKVAAAIAALVASSPAALDTLYELAAALGDDANFAATMTAALAGKAPATLLDQIVIAAGMTIDHTNAAQPLEAVQTLIESRVGDYSLDTGTANAKVIALNPAIAAYTGNFGGAFKNLLANTGAVTADFGGGAVPLVSDAGAALVNGDLPAGHVVGYQYIHVDAKAYITTMVQSQTLTQSVANTLYAPLAAAIDHETGTFTPGAEDQSGHPFPSYQAQSGTYTKIGNRVHISLYFRTLGLTTGMNTAQQLRITGLPFAAGNSFTLMYSHCMANVTALAPSTYLGLMARGSNGTTYLNVHAVGGDAASPYSPTIFTVANFEQGSAAEFHIETTYQTT